MGPSERDGKAERDRCVVRKGPPCPRPMGTDNWGGGSASRATRATWSCFSKRGHKSAMSKEAEAVQGASTGPGARRPAF